ncbi:MAG: phosphatidylglycerol lysyltransferase domain-containing protein [Tepidisphaeraceae bacterium]
MSSLDAVRDLVMRYGWNAMAFQIVNRGIEHWFSERGDAVIGYARAAGTRVVAGAPVCAGNASPKSLTSGSATPRWPRSASATSVRPVACSMSSASCLRIRSSCSARNRCGTRTHGQTWCRITARCAQLHRAANKQVRIDEWPIERATRHPELQHILDAWLDTRGLPSMHFMVEPQTLDRLEGRRVFVATREGAVVGFVVASPVPSRCGWLTEQFVRAPGAPNGTIELLLDFAIRRFASEGAEYLTMGLVPLAEHNWDPHRYSPTWLRWTMRAARKFGRRFYNFEGLDSFKSKLRPDDWEPIYAISNEAHFSPRMIWAIASVFAAGSPIGLVARGAFRLAKQRTKTVTPS